MEILYKVHNNLYVNMRLINVHLPVHFVLDRPWIELHESDRLWLEREPLVSEVIDEFAKYGILMILVK